MYVILKSFIPGKKRANRIILYKSL